MQYYHPFKKTVKGKNGKTKRVFYYWYYENGVQKQKVIKDKSCKSIYDAAVYCSQLPPPRGKSAKIKNIAADMFIFGSEHLRRREQLGYSCKPATVRAKRQMLDCVVQQFGEYDLADVKIADVFNYLMRQSRTFGWKNRFISTLRDVYQQATFDGMNIPTPDFPTFKGASRKADPFNDDELPLLLNRKNFSCERNYLLFLLITTAGLRVSEARAFQARQFLPDLQMILVDGFMDGANKIRNPYNKCGSKENPKWRLVLIPEMTASALADFLAENRLNGNDFVFTTTNGNTLRICSIRCAFFSAIRRAGIAADGRRLTIHSLRYTFVTRTRAYLDADTVRQMAGHTAIEMTDYYTRRKIQDDKRNLSAYIGVANRFFQLEKG